MDNPWTIAGIAIAALGGVVALFRALKVMAEAAVKDAHDPEIAAKDATIEELKAVIERLKLDGSAEFSDGLQQRIRALEAEKERLEHQQAEEGEELQAEIEEKTDEIRTLLLATLARKSDRRRTGPVGDHRQTHDVFICHSSADKEEYVLPLATALEEGLVDCWLDNAEILLGDSISQRISEGLSSSRFVLLCLSGGFVGRSWPEKEMNTALSMEGDDGVVRVLPLILSDRDAVLQEYPLLRDKKHIVWTNAGEVADLIIKRVRVLADHTAHDDAATDDAPEAVTDEEEDGQIAGPVTHTSGPLREQARDADERAKLLKELGEHDGATKLSELGDQLRAQAAMIDEGYYPVNVPWYINWVEAGNGFYGRVCEVVGARDEPFPDNEDPDAEFPITDMPTGALEEYKKAKAEGPFDEYSVLVFWDPSDAMTVDPTEALAVPVWFDLIGRSGQDDYIIASW